MQTPSTAPANPNPIAPPRRWSIRSRLLAGSAAGLLLWLVAGYSALLIMQRAEIRGQLSRVADCGPWCQRLWPWDAQVVQLRCRCARRTGDLQLWTRLTDTWARHSPQSGELKIERELMRMQSGAFTGDLPSQVKRFILADVDSSTIAEAAVLGLMAQRDFEQANTTLAWWEGLSVRKNDARLYRGILLRLRGEEDRARAEYEQILTEFPQHELALTHLADLLSETESPQRALEKYGTLLSQVPRSVAARVGAARCLRMLARWDAAKAVLQDLLNQPEPPVNVVQEAGQIALEQGDYDLAEKYLTTAMKSRTPTHDERMAVATNFALQKQPERGLELLQKDARIESLEKQQRDLQVAILLEPGRDNLQVQLRKIDDELSRTGP